MTISEYIFDLGHKIYASLTKPKTVKFFTILAMTIFIGAICMGVIVAVIGPPGGYNPINNYISDMGSFNYTPLPYFLDYGNMISSILLIPCVFYLEKKLAPLPKNEEDLKNMSRMRLRLGSIGWAWMIIGIIGMFGTGLFSEDRNPFYLHWWFTIVVFFGFAFCSFFYGLLITFFDTEVPKVLGVYMFIVPMIIVAILFGFGFQPFHEWIMFFSLLGWILPLNWIFLKELNREIESE